MENANFVSDLNEFPRPSVATDIVALRPSGLDNGFAFEIMLVRRDSEPEKGRLALPGGFVHGDCGLGKREKVGEAAWRVLKAKTGLETRLNGLYQIGVFSDPGRDNRSWTISCGFVTIFGRGEGGDGEFRTKDGVAKWCLIDCPTLNNGNFRIPIVVDGERMVLSGSYREDPLSGGDGVVVNPNELAFDHALVIATALLKLISFDKKALALYALPEEFTLNQYVAVYEYLAFPERVSRTNFARLKQQLVDGGYVEECLNGDGSPKVTKPNNSDGGHRPPHLFRRGRRFDAR